MKSYSKKKIAVTRGMLICCCVVTALLFLASAIMKPLVRQISVVKARQIASDLIGDAVKQVAFTHQNDAEQLVIISTADDGSITSISSNSQAINIVQAVLLTVINQQLEGISNRGMSVKVGSLTGNPLLNGRGFDINFRLQQTGSVKTELISSFESAGINQTKHSIYINVSVEIATVAVPFSEKETYDFTYLLSETIIVGKIPERYTCITGDTRDIISKINDY